MNTLFPGCPNYVAPVEGLFSLLHHEVLFEKSHDVRERINYIKTRKPRNEVSIRLRNIMYLGNESKHESLNEKILSYIKTHIPDCAWGGEELIFSKDYK